MDSLKIIIFAELSVVKLCEDVTAEVLPGVYICILYSSRLNKKEQQQQRE